MISAKHNMTSPVRIIQNLFETSRIMWKQPYYNTQLFWFSVINLWLSNMCIHGYNMNNIGPLVANKNCTKKTHTDSSDGTTPWPNPHLIIGGRPHTTAFNKAHHGHHVVQTAKRQTHKRNSHKVRNENYHINEMNKKQRSLTEPWKKKALDQRSRWTSSYNWGLQCKWILQERASGIINVALSRCATREREKWAEEERPNWHSPDVRI